MLPYDLYLLLQVFRSRESVVVDCRKSLMLGRLIGGQKSLGWWRFLQTGLHTLLEVIIKYR